MTARELLDEAGMLAAVMARDTTMDGLFVYGVLTTGIYCHPSCPSRSAQPDNMRFFGNTADAKAAGFRPCKRCKPDQACLRSRLQNVARLIRDQASTPLTLKSLSTHADLSPSRFQKAFKAEFGVSPRAFQQACRTHSFKVALREGESVTEASHEAGYGSASRVHLHATRGLGMSPSTFRAGGRGERIHFACRQTSLGLIMMAASSRGLCLVEFGESDEALRLHLQRTFPRAELLPSCAQDRPELDEWMLALESHMNGHAPAPDLPLDLRGTAFQMTVWNFLTTIPSGESISYTELASGIGKPRAVRAAASACAANRIALLVPCHRVLRGDGQLGGYRWGLARKKSLLQREQENALLLK
ncbi:bifunctional DNA-binding transcriptional regulator/O6-methylguanine-DNA methyltransferase Ada [Allohahella marinimesophila]|uniref:bifunctional DNA-binding transcriptional regulator/O6-methylguanine-DNA methyltransferase Ada n=1 Tax=Allohahella marinimesophila TaxID=1054972 RepID=UPI0031D3D422